MPTVIDPLNDPDHLRKTIDAIKALDDANAQPMRSRMRPINKPYGPNDFPIGTRVTHRRDSGGDLTTETISTVFYRKGGWSSEGHFVFVEGVGSPVPLDHLTPLPK